MIRPTIEEIKKYHQMAYDAQRYATEHYEEIVNRPHTYRLYGPLETSGIAPYIPRKQEKVSSPRKYSLRNNRRKNYMIYELDEKFHMLRVIFMFNYNKEDYYYHYFNYEGLVYACPFYPGENRISHIYTHALKFEDGHPVMRVTTGYDVSIIEYYEYLSEQEVEVSEYVYYSHKKDMWGIKTWTRGLEVIEDAPFESPHSPVLQLCYVDERIMDYDFSKFIPKQG